VRSAFSGRAHVGAGGRESESLVTRPRQDKAPKRFDSLAGIASAGGLMQRVEETGAGRLENRGEAFLRALSTAPQAGGVARGGATCRREKSAMRPSRSPMGSTPAQATSPAAHECVQTRQAARSRRCAAGKDGRLDEPTRAERRLASLSMASRKRIEIGVGAPRRKQALPRCVRKGVPA